MDGGLLLLVCGIFNVSGDKRNFLGFTCDLENRTFTIIDKIIATYSASVSCP